MMIAVGSLIIQPVNDRNIWITMVVTFLMVSTLLLIEYIVMKFDSLESFIYGKSLLVVEDGKIIENNLKKLRLTVDMLEVRLRQQSIQNFSDLEWATIETNGQLGYMVKPNKQYATKEDIQMLKDLIERNQSKSNKTVTNFSNSDTIFNEVKNNKHLNEIPENLK
nr:YetF domain-containing protein [Metabacillus crassostreae]